MKMKTRSTGIILVFFAIAGVAFGLAMKSAHAEKSFSQVEKAGEWLNQVESIYRQYTDVMSSAASLDELSQGLIEGEVQQNFAIRQGATMLLDLRQAFERVSAEHTLLPPPPRVKTENFSKLLKANVNYLNTLKGQVSNVIALSTEVYEAALSGDEDAQDKLVIKQVNQYVALLLGENTTISQRLTAVPPSSPAYALFSSISYSNEAIISVLQALAKILRGDLDLEKLKIGRAQAKLSLFQAAQELDKGRTLATNALQQYQAIKPRGERQHRILAAILEAHRTFPQSFDVEEELNTVLSDAITIWTDENSIAAMDDAKFASNFMTSMTSTYLKIDTLVNERMRLQAIRTNTLTKFR